MSGDCHQSFKELQNQDHKAAAMTAMQLQGVLSFALVTKYLKPMSIIIIQCREDKNWNFGDVILQTEAQRAVWWFVPVRNPWNPQAISEIRQEPNEEVWFDRLTCEMFSWSRPVWLFDLLGLVKQSCHHLLSFRQHLALDRSGPHRHKMWKVKS